MVENEEKNVSGEEETKVETVAEEKTVAPKKAKKKGLLVGILSAVGAVVVVAAILLVMSYINGSQAIQSYLDKDYKAAYESSQTALFLDQKSKDSILKQYVKEVLCENGSYYSAHKLLEESSLAENEKEAIYNAYSGLSLCKKGSEVTFGRFELNGDLEQREDLQWIVLNVVEENGRAKALLITKDVIACTKGFNRWDDKNSTYAKSEIHSWCEDTFYREFSNLSYKEGEKILQVMVSTPDSSKGIDSGEDVKAHAFVLSKQEAEQYFSGDMAKYLLAKCSDQANIDGAIKDGKGNAGYFLRNAGDGAQTVAGVTRDGVITEGCGKTSLLGIRPCVWIDLGQI